MAAGAPGTGNLILFAIPARHIWILASGLGMIAGQLVGALLLDVLLPVEGSARYAQTALGPSRPRLRAGAGGEQGKKTKAESVGTTVGGMPADQ